MHKLGGREVGRSGGDPARGAFRLPDLPTFRLSRLRTALKQITGMPDYTGYLKHARERHPDCPLLSEREFYEQYLVTRYAGGGSRCC